MSVVSCEAHQSISDLQEIRLGGRDLNVTFQSLEVFLMNECNQLQHVLYFKLYLG